MRLHFSAFLREDETRSLAPTDAKKPNKHGQETYLDAIWRELGISPNEIPDKIDSGPVEIDGYVFNQAIFKVFKPITLKDHMVRIKLDDVNSPNLNQKVYRRGEDGQLVPYEGPLPTHVFLISIKELADMISKAWQSAGQGAGGMPGGMPGAPMM
jgi:hypothetical protein